MFQQRFLLSAASKIRKFPLWGLSRPKTKHLCFALFTLMAVVICGISYAAPPGNAKKRTKLGEIKLKVNGRNIFIYFTELTDAPIAIRAIESKTIKEDVKKLILEDNCEVFQKLPNCKGKDCASRARRCVVLKGAIISCLQALESTFDNNQKTIKTKPLEKLAQLMVAVDSYDNALSGLNGIYDSSNTKLQFYGKKIRDKHYDFIIDNWIEFLQFDGKISLNTKDMTVLNLKYIKDERTGKIVISSTMSV